MLAAHRLGRRSVGVDLSESYLKQAVKRLTAVSLPLPLEAS
jgi:DNA modification methylase